MTRAQSVPVLLAILALTACVEASDVEGFSIPIATSTFFSATGETPPPGPSRALLAAPPSQPAPPPPSARMLAPPQIRGIYVSAYAAGSPAHRSSLLALTDSTELNSWVVDVKDDDGIRYRSGDALAKEVTRGTIPLHDLKNLVDTLLAHGIYPIARVVVFKDSRLAEARPEWAIRTPSGAIWRDKLGTGWMSPWDERVWEYNLGVAEEAARAGFREIQFDYVRFPEAYQSLPKQIHAKAAGEREEAIAGFLTAAKRRLGPRGVVVAADLFGLSMNDAEDVGIGHQWETLSPVVDHLLPMVYPSHYFPTHLPGIRAPNRMPYETVFTSVAMGVIRNDRLREAGAPPARIIPWIQAFTAGWVDRSYRYGPEQARAQMRAVYALGLEDWILWNGASKYGAVEGALEPELQSRAGSFVPPESLVARVDRMDGWGVAEARRRAVREWSR